MKHPIAVKGWRWGLSGFGLFLALSNACSGRQALPSGPAPEYERPELEPWDAGQPVDPFAAAVAEGEWVDEEPDADADAGDAQVTEAGVDAASSDAVVDAGAEGGAVEDAGTGSSRAADGGADAGGSDAGGAGDATADAMPDSAK